MLAGRTMLVRKCRPLPVECIVRGYLSGSGWAEYQKTGAIGGLSLPPGLVESQQLPEPVFTPSTKAELGVHDENISFERMAATLGADLAARVREISLTLYRRALAWAEPRGIIIADTKFEFGQAAGELLLIDEVLTPDSSRFWPQGGLLAPAAPRRATTSSISGTTWNPWAGTSNPRRRRCPRRSSITPGPATSRPSRS